MTASPGGGSVRIRSRVRTAFRIRFLSVPTRVPGLAPERSTEVAEERSRKQSAVIALPEPYSTGISPRKWNEFRRGVCLHARRLPGAWLP